MLKSKIRFGIIGCSSIAERTTIPAIIRAKNATLQTIGSRNIDKAKKFATKRNGFWLRRNIKIFMSIIWHL